MSDKLFQILTWCCFLFHCYLHRHWCWLIPPTLPSFFLSGLLIHISQVRITRIRSGPQVWESMEPWLKGLYLPTWLTSLTATQMKNQANWTWKQVRTHTHTNLGLALPLTDCECKVWKTGEIMLNLMVEQDKLSSSDWKYHGIFSMNFSKLIFLKLL